ncbi:hypothetical protein C8F01DRAFT_1260899 [Mycena amicta]|nr:hypothetical protein C8F01DRAFT_1260899 [Mycena amicta]
MTPFRPKTFRDINHLISVDLRLATSALWCNIIALEAVWKFASYLEWAVPEYKAEFIALDSDSLDEQADSTLSNKQNAAAAATVAANPTDVAQVVADVPMVVVNADEPRFLISKRPAYANVTADSMATDFHAPDFLRRIDDFLRTQSIPHIQEISRTSTFPVYKHLSIDLPRVVEVTTHRTLHKIQAVKGEPRKEMPKGIKPKKSG